ncbi:penicillin-binding protein 2 [Desulfococcaceae bacterium HSG8]|nr:penicillin-binding protein 2 [Desulfococcaceae bacterium HSG8]
MKPAINEKRIKLRIRSIGFLFIFLFLVIGSKAVYLQVFCYSDLFKRASDEYVRVVTTLGKRGSIYDINGREMAVSIDGRSVAVYPRHVKDSESVVNALAQELNIDRQQLNRKVESDRSFVWVKRQVTPRETQALRSLNLKGIDFIPEYSRYYPSKMLAAQVIGFTGIDGHGLEGIEFYYDRYLKGSESKFTVLKDALGRIFDRDIRSQHPDSLLPEKDSGNNLYLTIDRTIQFVTENALEEAVEKFSAKSGMAIVMVPRTGAVLALAHVPLFNPNSFVKFDRELWRNKAITDPFEPGSTMKVFSTAAALEYGGCEEDTIFFCENGAYRVGEDTVHDSRPYGWLTLQKIVKYSSNIGIIKVGKTVGPEALYKTLLDFGFGKKSDIDCPGETAGSLSHYKRWSEIDAGAISFGQGISVSAIQLISAVCAIANGGVLMKPYIVQAVTDPNGRPVESFGPQKVRRVISEETARTVKKMMASVVEKGGTGVKAALKGYSVCGKTGTAQKIDKRGKYAKGRYTASFVGFVPEEAPEIAILVVVDEPRKNHYGGDVAAPAFRSIAHKALNHLSVPPAHGTERLTASIGQWSVVRCPLQLTTDNGQLTTDN